MSAQFVYLCVRIQMLSQLPSVDTDIASYILLFNQAVWRKLPSPLRSCDLSCLMVCHRGVIHGNLAGHVAHARVDWGLSLSHTSVGDRKEKAPVLLTIV